MSPRKPMLRWIFPALAAALAITLVASGCASQTGPRLIGAAPVEQPAAAASPGEPLVYSAFLELSVPDPQYAADKARAFAEDAGGYLVRKDSWSSAGQTFVSVELAVPSSRFDSLYRDLRTFGELVGERLAGEPGGWAEYSHLTVQFDSGRTAAVPPVPAASGRGWDPARTFRRAFSVFVAVFGFLADILIWIIVLGGPFLLVLVAARLVVRLRRRRQAHP